MKRGRVTERMEKGAYYCCFNMRRMLAQRKLEVACPLFPSIPPTPPVPFQTRSRTEGNVLSMSLKYNFRAERNPIISLHGQRRLDRQRQQRTHSQWWMQWPVFPTSNMSIGAIQNMTNRPWLKQAYNGLLVLVIKCFHLLQKFQIFLAHHLFHSGSTVKDPKQIWPF